jgi:hypothetical protein
MPPASRALRGALLLALGLLLVLGARRCARPDRPERAAPPREAGPDPVITRTNPTPRTTDEGAAVLGINEGISLPPTGPMRMLGGDGTLKRRVSMLRSLGARIVRANSHTWPNLEYSSWKGSFAEADRLVRTAGDAGIDLILVIGPWPGTRTALYTDAYVPKDLDGYAAWVESVVERYDGDTLDDMPGLVRPVLAWEVDNEPDQHHLVAPRRGEGDPRGADGLADEGHDEAETSPSAPFETPAEYAQVLVATSAAIRRADPEARVLLGGMYRPAMPAGRAYLADVLAAPGARAAIDALSLHCYFSNDDLGAVQRTMRTARALAPELPVWITETSVPSTGEQGWVDELWQARMVAGIVGAFLADGADRVLWHSLIDAPNTRVGPLGYATNSLFRGTLEGADVRYEPKPAADVFRRLAGHLASADPASFAEIPADGGRILETDVGWLVFDGEPALPPEGQVVEDLLTGEVVTDIDRAPAPAWITR